MAEKKTIELEVKTNIDSAKSQFDSLSKSIDKTNKSASDLDATFSEVYGDLQPLTTRMGEAEDRLYELALAGKETTDEYKNLLNVVANYRRTQIQTDLVVDSAATTLSQKMTGAVSGVAGAFSAAQGAMGLFGSESENVQRALLKVQSAMVLSQGIESVVNAKNQFSQLGSVIGKTAIGQKLLTAAQVVGAATMRVLNMVMNANPVLLLVTGVTALVGAMALLRNSTDKEAEAQKELNRQHELSIKLMKQTQEEVNKYISSLNKSTKNKIDLRKAEGASAEELYKIEKEGLEEQIRYTKLMHDSGAKLTAKQYEDQKQAKLDLKILEAQHNTDINELNKKNAEELEKKAEERRKKKAEDDRIEAERRAMMAQGEIDADKATYEYFAEQDRKEAERKEAARLKEMEDEQMLANFREEIRLQGIRNEEEAQAKKKLLRQQEIQFASDGFKLIGDFTELMGKRTEKERRRAFKIKKAADLASATIDGTKAVLSTYADTPGGPIIKGVAAGIAGAFSAIQIAKISKQQFDGGGSNDGGSGTTSSTPSTPSTSSGVIAPKFNVVGASANQLNTLQQQPIQAYVVSGDVTSAQSLDRNRIKNATL